MPRRSNFDGQLSRRLVVRCDPTEYAALAREAVLRGMTLAQLVRAAIAAYRINLTISDRSPL